MADVKHCVVCAWREDCLKKHRATGGLQVNCLDFVRDVSIAREPEPTVREQDKPG